jgi:hypothetical protein
LQWCYFSFSIMCHSVAIHMCWSTLPSAPSWALYRYLFFCPNDHPLKIAHSNFLPWWQLLCMPLLPPSFSSLRSTSLLSATFSLLLTNCYRSTDCGVMWYAKVMSVKALGIALKLTFQGQNQLIYPQTSVFAMVVVTCVLTQMNYLNKVSLPSFLCFFCTAPETYQKGLFSTISWCLCK